MTEFREDSEAGPGRFTDQPEKSSGAIAQWRLILFTTLTGGLSTHPRKWTRLFSRRAKKNVVAATASLGISPDDTEALQRAATLYLPEPPSIGIASFNLKQRTLILDQLAQRAASDRDFAQRLAIARSRRGSDSFEGLFVKNLENVQGDERDHIHISSTFGTDLEGSAKWFALSLSRGTSTTSTVGMEASSSTNLDRPHAVKARRLTARVIPT